MDTLLQDLRYTVGALRRTPRFTTVAELTPTLEIGANTAIFRVLNGVVLRPLPVPETTRSVNLGWSWGASPIPSETLLVAVGFLASCLPARRAARVVPMIALRAE